MACFDGESRDNGCERRLVIEVEGRSAERRRRMRKAMTGFANTRTRMISPGLSVYNIL